MKNNGYLRKKLNIKLRIPNVKVGCKTEGPPAAMGTEEDILMDIVENPTSSVR